MLHTVRPWGSILDRALGRHREGDRELLLGHARGGFLELALGVEDACVAHLVLQLQRAVRVLVDEQRGAVDVCLGRHRLVILQEEHRDLDVLLDLVAVLEHADPRVERDPRQHLRRRRPVLLRLVQGGERLADR
eukprot:5848930-Prymnesium_polylepis.1